MDSPLHVPTIVVLIGILCLYFVLGMFLDGIGMIRLTVPIILPAIKLLGIHPIVFGILVIRMETRTSKVVTLSFSTPMGEILVTLPANFRSL